MKSFLKKIIVAFTALTGIFVMASCQSVEHNATVPNQYCSVAVVKEEGTSNKVAVVTLAVQNPTIYNTKEITFKYQCEDASHNPIGNEETVVLPVGVRHGVTGAFSYPYKAKPGEAEDVVFVKITESYISGYNTLWETYMPAFIVAISLAALSVLFYCIELFRRGITRATAKEMFKEHAAAELTVLGLVLIICLIPLIFSSWVTTIILLGGFIASILAAGLFTLVRISVAK